MSRSVTDVSKKARHQERVRRYLDEALGIGHVLPESLQPLLAEAILVRVLQANRMVILIRDHLVCCDYSTGSELWRSRAHFDPNRARKFRLRKRLIQVRDSKGAPFLQFDLTQRGLLVVD